MSRAALWHQEANIKERERLATETYENALQEGKSRSQKGLIALVRDDSFNLNPMLLQNISKSPYFLKTCNKVRDWTSLVDEIYFEVKHMDPWTQGAAKSPSTAFCLLLRLFTIRCSEKQMKLMLDHVDSPYIRCIGFLYLRYAAEPSIIWDWFQPYLYDEEPVRIHANVNKKESTVGDFARGLLNDLEYSGTRLPRLPVAIERDIKVKLLQEGKIEERAQRNLRDTKKMEYYQTVGSKIRALYGDDENPITWYDAMVDRIVRKDDETGLEFHRPKFLVTFPEYGNTELITLGDIEMPGDRSTYESSSCNLDKARDSGERYDDRWRRNDCDNNVRNTFNKQDYRNSDETKGRNSGRREYDCQGSRYNSASRGSDNAKYSQGRGHRHGHERSRSRSRDREFRHHHNSYDRALPDKSHLMQEVLRKERDNTAAKGSAYGARLQSLKSSIVSGEFNQKSGAANDVPARSRKMDNPPKKNNTASPSKHKTAEDLAAIAAKKRKLMAKYG